MLHESPLSGVRILILEDEFLIAMDLEQLCRDNGAEEVTIFRTLGDVDGPVAGRFDAAIVDLMLSGQTTLDFARGLSAERLPFVFATGYGETSALLAEFASVPVIGKPYSSDEVITALVRALKNRPAS